MAPDPRPPNSASYTDPPTEPLAFAQSMETRRKHSADGHAAQYHAPCPHAYARATCTCGWHDVDGCAHWPHVIYTSTSERLRPPMRRIFPNWYAPCYRRGGIATSDSCLGLRMLNIITQLSTTKSLTMPHASSSVISFSSASMIPSPPSAS